MQFYRIDGIVKNGDDMEEREIIHDIWDKKRIVYLKTCDLNQKFKDKLFFFVAVISDYTFTAGVICREPLEYMDKVEEFLKDMDLELKEVQKTEITFNALRNLLQTASRNRYIEDEDDDVLEPFDLTSLTGRYGRMISYDEEMIEETGRPQVYKVAEKFLANLGE